MYGHWRDSFRISVPKQRCCSERQVFIDRRVFPIQKVDFVSCVTIKSTADQGLNKYQFSATIWKPGSQLMCCIEEKKKKTRDPYLIMVIE